jgi:hypothetical protein
MKGHSELLTVGLTSADIAWPIILGMCVLLMILPFAFLFVGRGEEESENPPR